MTTTSVLAISVLSIGRLTRSRASAVIGFRPRRRAKGGLQGGDGRRAHLGGIDRANLGQTEGEGANAAVEIGDP